MILRQSKCTVYEFDSDFRIFTHFSFALRIPTSWRRGFILSSVKSLHAIRIVTSVQVVSCNSGDIIMRYMYYDLFTALGVSRVASIFAYKLPVYASDGS